MLKEQKEKNRELDESIAKSTAQFVILSKHVVGSSDRSMISIDISHEIITLGGACN